MAALATNDAASRAVEAPTRTSLPVKQLDAPHPEYDALWETWYRISLLYAGGWALKKNAEVFLTRRPKELSDIFAARLQNFTYHNHFGTALDWYCSTLFGEDPQITAGELDAASGEIIEKPLQPAQKQFYDSFLVNCDRGGTSYTDTFRKVFSHLLLYQKSYVLMDLPPDSPDVTTLEQQKASGTRDQAGKPLPYLAVYSPMEAKNWELDAYGNLNWIIFSVQTRVNVPKQASKIVDKWFFFDRTTFEVWEREHPEDEKSTPDNAVAYLVDSGDHLLAKQKQVPVTLLSVPDGLWLANRAMLAAESHLNTDNVLDWALFMAALCMPVIMSDADVLPTLSEAGFIKLPKDSKYEWTEPVGTSFQHLADRLQELTENIFRSFYLIHQGRSGRATPNAQSGVSKQMDMMPSKDIMKMFGDLLRAFMQRVLNLVSLAHGDGLQWDVRGFEFHDSLDEEEIKTIGEALLLNVPSPLFEKEAHKRVVQKLLPDANPGTQRRIFEEIDKAPDKLTRDLGVMKKTADARAQAMGSDTMIAAADKFHKTVIEPGAKPA